jgi:hypothetical protein
VTSVVFGNPPSLPFLLARTAGRRKAVPAVLVDLVGLVGGHSAKCRIRLRCAMDVGSPEGDNALKMGIARGWRRASSAALDSLHGLLD